MEYVCAATDGQMYSVGEETEVVPNNFEEATITGPHWVYKINSEKLLGQLRLVPTALERPSPSRRGTVISAREKSTLGNEPASMGTPNTWVAESTTAYGVQARTKSRMERWTTRKGERMKETRKKASFAVGSAEMK